MTREIPPPGRAAIWQVTIGAVLISFSAVFVKLSSTGPTVAGFYRVAFGGAILVPWVLVRGDSLWRGSRAALLACVAGLLFAADLAFWHRSIQHVGPGLATILSNFQVFLLAGVGVAAYGEHAGWRLWSAIPLAIGGLFLLFGRDWNVLPASYHLGVLFGVLTAASYGTYLLILRTSQRRAPRLSAEANLAWISVLAALLLAALAGIEGESFAIPNAHTAAALAAYGVVSQVVAWVLISRGIPHVPASRVGLILLLQPSLAFVWDVLFFHRPTDVLDVVGAALAVAAIYFGTTGKAPAVE